MPAPFSRVLSEPPAHPEVTTNKIPIDATFKRESIKMIPPKRLCSCGFPSCSYFFAIYNPFRRSNSASGDRQILETSIHFVFLSFEVPSLSVSSAWLSQSAAVDRLALFPDLEADHRSNAPAPNPNVPPTAAPTPGRPTAAPIAPSAAAPRKAPIPVPFSRVVNDPPEQPASISNRKTRVIIQIGFISPLFRELSSGVCQKF